MTMKLPTHCLALWVFTIASTSTGVFSESRTKWNHLKVKYQLPFAGKFNLPLSVGKIGSEYEFLKAHEEFPLVSLYIYPEDPRVQLMYDDHENVAGLRVAYMIDEIKKKIPEGEVFPYSYENKPIFKKGSYKGKHYYYIDVLFIHPDVLKTGGPAEREEAVGTGAYISMDGKTWTELPRKEEDTAGTDFVRQALCIPGMGQHYFYNMTESMRCEDHQPVFLLYFRGELVGMGLIPFGTFDHTFGRDWFEDPPKLVINTIVSTAPTCLADWVERYGTISLHIYFREFNELTCLL